MIVGFTGTRQGMSAHQQNELIKFLQENLKDIEEVHHGDCFGSDAQFDSLCKHRGIKRVIHPPNNSHLRAFCDAEEILPSKDYLSRNRDIARVCDILIATPLEMEQIVRSGTWSTIRYAEQLNKKVMLLKRWEE